MRTTDNIGRVNISAGNRVSAPAGLKHIRRDRIGAVVYTFFDSKEDGVWGFSLS